MQYKTIHTLKGLEAMANAEATGRPINLTAIAVGDGGGNPVVPLEDQTQLVREIAGTRRPPNRIYQDPINPMMFTIEMAVPASIGGFVIREIGVFDDTGALFAVANLPDMYKPADGEGAYSDAAIRMQFMATNADIVTIVVDPNVAWATQTWVTNTVSVAGLIPGGLYQQVLRKRSNMDGDVEWADPTEVNVTVSTIEEEQILAAGQTVVNLLRTNTEGLAIYVEGVRLAGRDVENGWKPHATIPTRITLGKSYPANSKLIAVQNEPAGTAKPGLQRDLNLSDLQNVPTARTNLDVYSKEESNAAGQPGDCKFTFRSTAPAGWLKANGAAVNRTAYAGLFAVIGTTFGPGDGFNTFNLPDLRGEFVRGWDDGRGIDVGRALGTGQASQNLAHTHSGATSTSGSHSHSYTDGRPYNPPGNGLAAGSNWPGVHNQTYASTTGLAGSHSHSFITDNSGGTEARPRNVAALALIKY